MTNQKQVSLLCPQTIFNIAIGDAERLLAMFDNLPSEQHKENEVLKRAAYVMTFTAWESFFECWIEQQVLNRLAPLNDDFAANYMQSRLKNSISRLHNPTSAKVKELSKEYLQQDVTESWKWANFQQKTACEYLDKLLSRRGDLVHQARTSNDPKHPHAVKRDDVDKAIRFLKGLVGAMVV